MEAQEQSLETAEVHRSRKFVIAAILLICLLLAVAALWRARAGSSAAIVSTHADLENTPYAAVAAAKRETIANELTIAGQFIPYQNVDLHAKVADTSAPSTWISAIVCTKDKY